MDIQEFSKAVAAAVFAVGAVVAFYVKYDPALLTAAVSAAYSLIGIYAVWKVRNKP